MAGKARHFLLSITVLSQSKKMRQKDRSQDIDMLSVAKHLFWQYISFLHGNLLNKSRQHILELNHRA